MQGLSAINARRFCNENGIRIRKTFNDSEIKKEITKSNAEVINKFLQNIVRKNDVLFLKVSQIYLLFSNNSCLIKLLLLIFYLYHVLRLVETTEEK